VAANLVPTSVRRPLLPRLQQQLAQCRLPPPVRCAVVALKSSDAVPARLFWSRPCEASDLPIPSLPLALAPHLPPRPSVGSRAPPLEARRKLPRDPPVMSSRPSSSSSSRRSSSPFSAGHRRPPTSSSSASSYFSAGRLIPRSSPSSVSSHYYGGGGSSRSATPARRGASSVVPAPALAPVPFPSSDELVNEDTSRSGDSISVTIRFRPLRWGMGISGAAARICLRDVVGSFRQCLD
jgi:hypothetical protein